MALDKLYSLCAFVYLSVKWSQQNNAIMEQPEVMNVDVLMWISEKG